jgi:hypothetical protein
MNSGFGLVENQRRETHNFYWIAGRKTAPNASVLFHKTATLASAL